LGGVINGGVGVGGGGGLTEPENGKIAYIENTSNISFLVETAKHEIGHNFGLSHKENSTHSIMSYSSERSSNFNKKELIQIYNYGDAFMNQGTNREISTRSSDNWFSHTSTNEKPYFKNVSVGDTIPKIVVNK
jgi:hypothetical protein